MKSKIALVVGLLLVAAGMAAYQRKDLVTVYCSDATGIREYCTAL
jgi:hypothetical protein